MVVGVMTIEVDIPEATSLKGKRAVLNRLKSRVQNKFNVSIAEVDANEVWNYACLGLAVVANQQTYANQVLDKALDLIETLRDCSIVDHSMEFMHLG